MKEEVCNSRQAIWLRPKNEVKPEEYNTFYKQIARDMDDPLKTIHVAAEGTTEFRALMFIPAHRGMDFLAGPEKKSGLDLYVRRVLHHPRMRTTFPAVDAVYQGRCGFGGSSAQRLPRDAATQSAAGEDQVERRQSRFENARRSEDVGIRNIR